MIINWEALGAVGETLGAIGVIFTLGYLALQVRESNRASRRTAMQEVLTLNSEMLAQLNKSKESANIYFDGLEGKQIDPDAERYFHLLIYQTVILWERLYFLQLDGQLDDWIWDDMHRQLRMHFASPRFQHWFKINGKKNYNKKWSEYVFGQIEIVNKQNKELLQKKGFARQDVVIGNRK
jgi:hypothetical protein